MRETLKGCENVRWWRTLTLTLRVASIRHRSSQRILVPLLLLASSLGGVLLAAPPAYAQSVQTITMATTGSTTFDQSGIYNVDASTNDNDPGVLLVYNVDAAGNTADCSVGDSGSVSFTSVGACTIDVNSGATENYAAANQAQQTLTVSTGVQTITMATTGSTTFDQSGIYNVDASTNDNDPGVLLVYNVDAAGNTADCSVGDSGSVSFTSVGACTIDVNSGATENYAAANQAQQTLTVSTGVQTITMATTGSTTFDQSGIYNVDASTNDNDPGVLLVYNVDAAGNTADCSVGDSGSVSFTSVGACTIDVNSGATENYAAANQAQQTLTVSTGVQTITMATTGSTTFDQSGIYNVDASTNDNDPGVLLVYNVDAAGNTADCSVGDSGSVSFTSVGACTIDVNSGATENYAAANQAQQTLTVSTGVQTITMATTGSTTFDQSGIYNVDASTNDNDPGVLLVYNVDAAGNTADCSVGDSGSVSFTSVGACTIDVNSGATENYAAANQAQQTLTVSTGVQTITMATTGSTTFDQSGIYNVDASTNDNDPGVLLVYNVDAAGNTADCSVGDSGSVSFTSVGACTIDVNSGATENYAAANQAQQTLTVSTEAPTTPTISNLPASGTYGGGFTAIVSTDGDGTKSVTSNSTGVCTASGLAVSYVGVGTCSLTAHVAAGTNYGAADGTAQSFSVGKEAPTTPTISNLPASGTYGGGFTAIVSTDGDGTKSVTSNSTGVCTASGLAVSYVGVGTCSLTAHVAAGTNYGAADGTAQSFSVGKEAPTTPTISNLPASGTYGGGFTAIVSTDGDGTKSVTSNSTGVCTASGLAVSYVGVGTCSLTAHVAAGTNYGAADGTAQSFSVGKEAPTTPTISNLPASGTYGGGFTAIVSTDGDGTKSVTSNSTGVCTASGLAVSYVGVGTCSLTAHVAAGTNYGAADGTAQSFSVGKEAPTTPTISNLPASGTYGGGFTAIVSTDGDGTKSVTSNSTGVCTASGLAVSYVGVGTCSLTAHVAAGTNYGAADGTAQSFSVGKEAPTTPTISNLPASGTYGGGFTAIVSTDGDGTKSVTSNSTGVCTASGLAVSYVGVGTCSLTAHVAAGTNYGAADGTAQSFSVGKEAPTTPTISNLPASGTYGGGFTAIVSTDGDGTKSVTSNSTGVCTASGLAVSYVGVGTCSLTAHVAAGTNYGAADGTAQSFSVGKEAPTTPTISNLPASGTYGGGFTAIVSTDGDGTKSVTSNSTGVCTASGLAVSYVGVGTCSLTAHVAAGTNYGAADGTAQSFSVSTEAPTTPTISNLPASGTYGGGFTAIVSTDGDGTKSVTSNSTGVCTASGLAVSYVGVGTCSLTAHVAAGTNYGAADGTAQSFSVGKEAPTTPTISNLPASGTYGGGFTAIVSTDGDGTKSVTSNSTGVCTASGLAVSYVGVGTCSLTAHVAAGTNYGAADGTAQSFSVGKEAPTTPTISNLPASGTYGGGFTAIVSTDGDGTKSVTSNSTGVCTASGLAVSYVGVGTCSLTAHVAAGTNYGAADGTAQSFSVGKEAQTIAFTSTAPSNATVGGQTYTVTATATSGLAVTFSSATTSKCTVSDLTVNFIGAGTCTIDANQAGNANYAAAQATQSFSVGPGSQTITQVAPATGTTTPGEAFTGQLKVSGSRGTVTYTQSSGAPYLKVSSSGKVSAPAMLAVGTYEATGSDSDTHGDTGSWRFALKVTATAITQATPTSGTVSVPDSSAFTDQLATTGGTGAVSYLQLTGSKSVKVSLAGKVSVPARLAKGSYTATGIDSDIYGDTGIWSFALTVTANKITQLAPATATIKAGKAFSGQLKVSDSHGTVTYAQSSGAPSVTVSSSGKVSAPATLAAGTYKATGTERDSLGDTGIWSFALTVTANKITQLAPATATIKAGKAFSGQLKVSDSHGTVTYAQSSGAPYLKVSSSGKVSAPAMLAAGTYKAQGTDRDSLGDTGSWRFALKVTATAITQATPTSGTVSVPDSSAFSDQLATTGGIGAVSYDQLTGSSSVKVSSSGKVTVTGLLAKGSYSATGSDSDTHGDSGSWSYTLTVTATAITQVTPTSGTVSVPDSSAFTDQLATTGGTGTVTYVQSSGAPSVTVSSSGAVSVPGRLAKGSYTATGIDSDIYGDTGIWSFALTVTANKITQLAPATATIKAGKAFSGQLKVSDSHGTVTYAQSSGAPSVTVSSSGKVSAPATLAAGTYKATGTDRDSLGDTGIWSFALTVTANKITQLAPATATIKAGKAFSGQLKVSDSHGTVTYAQSSGAPSVTVSSSGKVSAPATLAAGTYKAKGTDRDSLGDTGIWSFALTVTANKITQLAPATATTGAGKAFSGQLEVSDSHGTVTYAQSSGAPSVKVSSSGKVSAPATLAAGTYKAKGTDRDSLGDSGIWSFALTVTANKITQLAPATATTGAGKAFTDQLEVSGSHGTVTYAQSSGAPHLKVSSSGKVSAPATLAAGTYKAKGTDRDSLGDAGIWSFTLKLTANKITQLAPTSATITAGKAFTDQLKVAGSRGTVTFTQSSGAQILTVSSSGAVLAPEIFAAGIYKVTGTVRDSFGDTGTWSFTLTVDAAASPLDLQAAKGLQRHDKPASVPRVATWELESSLDRVMMNFPRIAAAAHPLDQNLVEWVRRARSLGATWRRVGEAPGVTRQSGWERFSGEK